MSLLCKLGLHRWKPRVVRARKNGMDFIFLGLSIFPVPVLAGQWLTVGHRCRRCGKRK